MKKIFTTIFLLLTSAFMYWSCKKENLDLLPLGETEVSFYNSESDFNRSVVGIYAKLSDFYWYNGGSGLHGIWHLPGDDITMVGSDAYEIFTGLNATNGGLNEYYKQAYQLIDRANTTMQKINASDARIYSTPGLKTQHLAEAAFLRGYMHFCLYNFFGTAPVRTQRVDTPDEAQLRLSNSTGTQLLDQAITDFQTAAAGLPIAYPATQAGRITANTANGFLGKALVFRASYNQTAADFQAAITAFNKISGASLVANYGDNFSALTENNAESLFEFQATQPGFDNVWLNNDFESSGSGSTSAYWGFYENHWSRFGAPPFIATDKYVAAFEVGDPRTQFSFDTTGKAIKKYVLTDQKSQSGVASVNNPRILRYADVLLLKAEAILESGATAEAIALINAVRTRARGAGTVPADYSTSEADQAKIFAWIAKERLAELGGEEGHRWFDLKRWHAAGKINLGAWDWSSASTAGVQFDITKNLLYPLPANELDLNPNMQQNPGY